MTKKKLIMTGIVVAVVGLIGFQKFSAFYGEQMMNKMRNKPPVVELSDVKEQEIFDKAESAGRLEAVYSVDVVARIQGWLQKRYFKEGAMVKKGSLLFLIEPSQYNIAVNQAKASMRQSRAALVNSEKELVRAKELVENDFVSKSYYDKALATRDQNRAMLDVDRANLAKAQLDYSYTRVTSPINGKIGKIFITEGNLVNPQTGTLAKIVSVDPIYAYFTLKSEDLLKFKKMNTTKNDLSNMKVELKLADGSIYPVLGKVQFVDNQIDPTAGTIALRATFPNEKGLLVPGDYINVVASSTKPRKVVLVPQVAVSDSTNGYFVYYIDKDNKAQIKPIKVDAPMGDFWIVKEGLSAGDKIVTKGLQKLAPGMPVKIEEQTASENKNAESDKKEK